MRFSYNGILLNKTRFCNGDINKTRFCNGELRRLMLSRGLECREIE